MAEAAFSEDGKYFSTISEDGRIKIWDTETNILKQEYTPNLHLSSPPTCLQWIVVTTDSKPSKARKKSLDITNNDKLQYIAIGTTSGKILLYSVAQADVESILEDQKNEDVRNNSITALDWSSKQGLFSCSKGNYIHEWDLKSTRVCGKYNVNVESKKIQGNISAIKLIPHELSKTQRFLVTASWQLRLWCLESGELVRTFGNSGSPCSLLTLARVSSHRKCYVVSGAKNERLLSFWDVTIDDRMLKTSGEEYTPNKKQRKKSLGNASNVTATYNFVLEDAPRIIDLVVRESDGAAKVSLAAVTRSGVVHYYGHLLNGSSVKPIKPSVTIQVATDDARPMPLQCCKFPKFAGDNDSGEMVVGYEATPGRILYERVVPDVTTKTQVLIRTDPSLEASRRVKETDEAGKVRSDDGDQRVTYVEPFGGVTGKRSAPGKKVEAPMEARLANLALEAKGRSKTAVNENLTKLLVQGLHSQDKMLILTVLQRDNMATAMRTSAALPPTYVPALLAQLADMATRRTTQCKAVCVWLTALLRCHSALLLATLNAPATADKFSQLLAVLTQRRSHLCQLLNLKGRLDLTISQRSAQDNTQADNEPILDYTDSTSEEEEDELENGHASASDTELQFEESDSDASRTPRAREEQMSDSDGD